MLDLGGIKKNIGEIEERIVNERREKNRRQQQVVFLLDRIETHFQKQQDQLSSAHQKIERLETALQEIASAVEKLAGQSKQQSEEHDEVLERVLDLDRKFHQKPDLAAQSGPRRMSGDMASRPGIQPVPADQTMVHRPEGADRPAAEESAAGPAGGEPQGAAAGSPFADPDHAIPDLAAAVPRDERPAAIRQGAERAAERPHFDRDSAERHPPERPASEHGDTERAGSEKGVPERRSAAERPARPDFSPDIRAIKALLNRDGSDRAGRESA